jgi:hypothetical protein
MITRNSKIKKSSNLFTEKKLFALGYFTSSLWKILKVWNQPSLIYSLTRYVSHLRKYSSSTIYCSFNVFHLLEINLADHFASDEAKFCLFENVWEMRRFISFIQKYRNLRNLIDYSREEERGGLGHYFSLFPHIYLYLIRFLGTVYFLQYLSTGWVCKALFLEAVRL